MAVLKYRDIKIFSSESVKLQSALTEMIYVQGIVLSKGRKPPYLYRLHNSGFVNDDSFVWCCHAGTLTEQTIRNI